MSMQAVPELAKNSAGTTFKTSATPTETNEFDRFQWGQKYATCHADVI